ADHFLDGSGDLGLVGQLGQDEHGVAHDHRWLGGVHDDDRPALLRPANDFDGLRGGFGELVDVGAGSGTGGFRGNRGNDLAVMHLGDPRHRRHHRDGGLAAAGDHVDVELVQVLLKIDHRHAIRADGCRRQVDQAGAGLQGTQEGVVLDVGRGRGGIENEVDVGKSFQAGQSFDALVGGGHAHARSTGQAIGGRVDADHGGHFDVLRVAQDLDHQVGADVAGTDDRSFEVFHAAALLAGDYRSLGRKIDRNLADALDYRFETVARIDSDHRAKGASQDNVASLERLPQARHGPRQPDGGVEWMAQAFGTAATGNHFAVAGHAHACLAQVDAR